MTLKLGSTYYDVGTAHSPSAMSGADLLGLCLKAAVIKDGAFVVTAAVDETAVAAGGGAPRYVLTITTNAGAIVTEPIFVSPTVLAELTARAVTPAAAAALPLR